MSIESDSEFLRTLAKGLAVIEAFNAETPAMTLSEVARRTAISPGAARRVLLTLQSLGYVGSDGSRFRLQARALRLGYAFLSAMPLTVLVQPWLTQLMHEFDESCSLGVLDGDEIVFIARAASRRLRRDYMPIGMRYPAHATSGGKLLLAMLPRDQQAALLSQLDLRALTPNTISSSDRLRQELRAIRLRGWASNDQEAIFGLRSLAVPIRVDGVVSGALTVSSSALDVPLEELERRWLPLLMRAAKDVSETVGARILGTDEELT